MSTEPAPPGADRAVIWDMDGVLIDSGPAHFAAWREIAAERGLRLTHQAFRDTFGMRSQEVVRHLFGDLPADQVEALVDRKEARFRDAVRAHLAPRPGVRELLAGLSRAGFAQAVASSAPPDNVALVLDVLGIRGAFRAVVTGADVRLAKPDPEVFLQAAASLGARPARCVVVEDATLGIAAARAAGMRCVAVAGTYPPAELHQADLAVDSLAELGPEDFVRLVG